MESRSPQGAGDTTVHLAHGSPSSAGPNAVPARGIREKKFFPLEGSWPVKRVFTGRRLGSFMGAALPHRRGARRERGFLVRHHDYEEAVLVEGKEAGSGEWTSELCSIDRN